MLSTMDSLLNKPHQLSFQIIVETLTIAVWIVWIVRIDFSGWMTQGVFTQCFALLSGVIMQPLKQKNYLGVYNMKNEIIQIVKNSRKQIKISFLFFSTDALISHLLPTEGLNRRSTEGQPL